MVVGTRSGVFAPVRNLGLIVVDEEHDASYKQEETPRYNGRDVAIVRAQAAGACVVLGSATPSLESRYNAERGKYTLLDLPERIEQRPLPKVELIDMRAGVPGDAQAGHLFAPAAGGYPGAPRERRADHAAAQPPRLFQFRGLPHCGERVQCANCSVTLTYHRRDRRLLCHYCNYADARSPASARIARASTCTSWASAPSGSKRSCTRNSPRPASRAWTATRSPASGHFETILAGFRDGDFDILVGTQMIAKGHDFPNVTLVGVVSADIGLGMPDFRAAERTFQLLTQVAGRAGRGHLPGIVLIQTINPDHYAIRFAARRTTPASTPRNCTSAARCATRPSAAWRT